MVQREFQHKQLRQRAVDIGQAYARQRIREEGHENRGPVVDHFLSMARMRLTDADDDRAAQRRQWCGAFVYTCYLEAVMSLRGATGAGAGAGASADACRSQVPFPRHVVLGGSELADYLRRNPTRAVINRRVPGGPTGEPETGDIWATHNNHVGMVLQNLGNGQLRTVEGNQTDLAHSTGRGQWNGVSIKSLATANIEVCLGF